MIPNKCSTFPPTSNYEHDGTAVWMQDESTVDTVEAWGLTLNLAAAAMGTPANPAVRDVNDSAPWK